MARPVLTALRDDRAVQGAPDRLRSIADRPVPSPSPRHLSAVPDVAWTENDRLTWEEFIGGVPKPLMPRIERPTLGTTGQPNFGQARAQEAGMNQPILFVSHWGVQPGALDQLRQLSEEVAARFRAEKPRTLSWLAYLNHSGTSISFVHLFADAEAMDLHIEAAAAGRKASKDLIEPRGWEIYGSPSDSALDQMRRTAEAAGVPLRLEPEVLAGGFLRLASA